MAASAAVFGCQGPSLSDAERAFFREAEPWGFILFARNVWSPDQVRRLTAALREAVGRDAPILIDQEGGRVARLRPPHWRAWPDALDQIADCPLGEDMAATMMRLRYRLIAAELHDVGIDVNCAPLADVAQPDTHPFLRSRCYGTDPLRVMQVAVAVANALMEGGVLPVVKHMPGHGRAVADSHHELPRVTASREALEDGDFLPFRTFADHPLAMTAHVVYTAIDPDRPATLSPSCVGAIRGTIGFKGALMTDDISMGALAGPIEARVAGAFAAGCDLVLHCNGDPAEMVAVAGAAPRLAGEAAARADRALAARRPPDGADPAEIEARLADPESWIFHA